MAHVVTSKTRERVNRPNAFGMHPKVAARLASFGIDPEPRAREARENVSGVGPARRRAALRAAFGSARPSGGIELSLDPNDVRVTPLLNQQALMVETNQYIADIVCPVQLVQIRAAKYKLWDRGPFRELFDGKLGPTGTAKEVSPTLSEDNYSTQLRGLKSFASDDTDNANPSLKVGLAAVREVMELLLVKREYDIAAAFHTAGSYASTNKKTLTSGGSGTNWAGSTSDPVDDILDLLEAIPGDVNHCVMADLVWHAAQKNATLKAILGTQLDNKGLLRPLDFSLYFGIPNVHITKADYRTAAGVRTRLWSETGLWLGAVNDQDDERTFARTFRLNQGAGGWITKRWRDEDRGGNGGVWVRTSYEEDRCKIVDASYGGILISVL